MIKIRFKPQGPYTLVRLLIDHPMETGRRRDDATGKLVPAHFIKELQVELNGQFVIKGRLSTAVSKAPYFSFRLNQAQPLPSQPLKTQRLLCEHLSSGLHQ